METEIAKEKLTSIGLENIKIFNNEHHKIERLISEKVDYIIDDYDNLCVLPIEVKSGKDYYVHTALNHFVSNKEYKINKAIVLSNEREVVVKDKIIYLPIYYVMFF